MSRPATATSGSRTGLIENWEKRGRFPPIFDIDFSGSYSLRGVAETFLFRATATELTLAMRGNPQAQTQRSQMRGFTQKRDRTLLVPVLKFAVRRTHTAQRLNPALHTFRRTGTFSGSHRQQKFLPTFSHTALPNVVGLLLRNHADTHASIRIHRERLHPAAAEVHRVQFRERRRLGQITFRKSPVFG